jgi:hypothetical protein
MSYYLRHSNEEFKGVMAAEVDNITAGKMMNDGSGHWAEKKYTNGRTRTVFVFDGEYVFTVGNRRLGCEVQVFIWKGSYLTKAD